VTLGDYLAIAGLLMVPLSLVCLYLRAIREDNVRFQKSFDKRLDLFSGRLDGQEARLLKVEQEKVSHAEWVRVVASQRYRQDQTRELVSEINGKLDATLGITRQMTRASDALEKLAEAGNG